jgi:hypothetical protein
MDEDVQFEDDVERAMQFTSSMKPGGSSTEPLHRSQKLKWDHKVNLIGEKIVDPLIHSCEKCALPILIYGRMIPCKHVFCLSCAKITEKNCPRCSQAVVRIEPAALGTVFVCTFGGTKHGVSGCHRTYLSQRDLQSHIAHRHYGAACEPPQQPAPRAAQDFMGPAPQQQQRQIAAFNVNQPPPSLGPHSAETPTLVYRQAPPGAPLPPQLVVAHGPPGMSQPPPGHILSPHGTHVINTGAPPPTGLPPGMMSTTLPPPPGGVPGMAPPPGAVLVPMGHSTSGPRNPNLITVQLHDEGDFRRDSQGSGARGTFSNPPPTVSQAPHDMAHYPPPHYPPPGSHGPPPQVTYTSQDHHQMAVLMAHPGGPPPAGMGPPPGGLVSMTLPPTHLGPPGGPPPQRLGPPPQGMHPGPPAQMHGGPPPQGMRGGPPPQGMRFPGPPPNWQPQGQAGQQHLLPPPGSRPSPGPPQYYQ